MVNKFQLYKTYNGPCPYLDEGIWENLSFHAEYLPSDVFEKLLNRGYRRSGNSIYHPICKDCRQCIPIRVDVGKFHPNKGQRRTWRKNQDLTIVHRPVKFTEESFDLYQRYQNVWHKSEDYPDPDSYINFLIQSPVATEMIHYYHEKTLVAIGWVDRLSHILSSVYFIFDPELRWRRLGVFSILYELEYCKKLDLPWYYLGFFVSGSPKMEYKAEYRPAQILVDKYWVDYS